MQELALATDSQLHNIARIKANYDYAASPKRSVERNFATFLPVMDSFMVGAGTNGTVGQKFVSGGNQLKDWGIFIVATNLYNKAVNKIVSKSETLQNFKENYPFLFGVANLALGVTAGLKSIKYVNKGIQKYIAPIIPQGIKNAVKGLIERSDNSGVGKAINNGMQSFARKYPKITKGLGVVSAWAMPVLCAGFLASIATDLIKKNSTEKKVFQQLSDARLAAAQQLAMQKADNKP